MPVVGVEMRMDAIAADRSQVSPSPPALRETGFPIGPGVFVGERVTRIRSVGRIVIRRLGCQDGGLRLRLQSALRAEQ